MDHPVPNAKTSERPRSLILMIATLVVVLSGVAPRSGPAAGFDFYEQGSKAMGMAGAFVAQADDPTTIFYNIGGLALLEEKKGALGLTAFTPNDALYQGLPPGIGAGTAAEQDPSMALQPHAYLALPVTDRMKVGVGLYSPFYLETRWVDPDRFAGRGVSTGAKLVTWEVNPSISLALSPKLGIGVGLMYRTSEFSQGRRFFLDDPFTGEPIDVAAVDVNTNFSDGLGWHAGVLHKLNERLSWGFSYRSGIMIDYSGVGSLSQIITGNAQFDELVAATLPFDQDLAVNTRIDFPDSAVFGVAFGLTESILLEADLQRTGWGGISRLEIASPSQPLIGQEIRLDFEDAVALRIGAQYTTATGTYYRGGFAIDETPQPDLTVGAFVADATRTLLAVGFGKDPLDLAFLWVDAEQRVIADQVDGLDGSYRYSAWKLSITLSL